VVTIKGKAAKAFVKKLGEPLSERQRAVWVEADRVYGSIQRKDTKS
jgi:hypothetical protein